MFWCVMENDAMRWITQKSGSACLRLQDAAFAFDAQIIGDIRFSCHKAYQCLRKMSVEIIRDKVPLANREIRLYPAANMCGEILLGARRLCPGSNDFAHSNIKVENERQGSMTDVLKLTPLNFSRTHRQPWIFSFQCLDTRHFINAFESFTLLAAFSGLLITSIDVVYFFVKSLIRFWRQPISNLMGLEIALFLKALPHVGRRSFLQCLFS